MMLYELIIFFTYYDIYYTRSFLFSSRLWCYHDVSLIGTWRTTIIIRNVWRSRIARTSRRWSGIVTNPAVCVSRARARPDGRVVPETEVAVARRQRRRMRRQQIGRSSTPLPSPANRPYDRSQAASAAQSDSSWSYLCSWSSYALFLPFWYCYRFILKPTAQTKLCVNARKYT